MNSSEEIAVSGMSAGRSAMRMGPAELVQAAAMARRFYLEGKSKIQIAEEFGVSRFKVARVLETALERDLVRIEIRVPAELDAERSDALRARYGLRHAVVVESPADAEESPDPENLGEVAADLLAELVNEGDVLGLAWGRSTIHMAAELSRLPPCTVVQLTGVYDAGTAERGSVEAVRRAAQVSGGDAHPIYAPMLLPDAATAAALRNQTGLARKGGRPLLSQVKMGLGWEPAFRGKDIDLDASVIAYGPQRNHIDSCYFGKLSIVNGAIKHSGDNLTGEGGGDDEVIVVDLGRLPQEVTGLVFTVNSFSGQKFTEVAKAYCRLLDAATGEELVRFDLTNAEAQTGVIMAKLIKQFSGEWEMTAVGDFVKSRTVRGMVKPAAAAL
ncbi:TerD family protein [Streptomyces sp. NPDC005568]|uniref:TerD family protein n=1 Tax=Streptomyces sp. NPDC005568 TaxID=3156887 RepID=UPI0033A757AF